MTRKKIIIGIVIALGVFIAVKHHHQNAKYQQEVIAVQVEKVKQGNIPLEADAVGTLVAAQNVEIAPETAGQVSQILFQDGSFVKKGTPLIQLDNAVYKSKFDSAMADLNLSQTTFKRMSALAKSGIISRQDMEKAAADLKEKQAAAQESQVMLGKMQLIAPFDGVTGKCMVSPGDYVSVGQALVSLTDTHHLRVEYTIAEKYLSALKLGQEIVMTTSAYPGKRFTGHVAFIAPTINTQNRTISVYAEVPNDNQQLSAGLFVNVKHSLGMVNNVLLVPAMSLVATIDGHQVYKVVNGKAQAMPIEIGQRTLDSVQITNGLALNDDIVVAGQQKIRDGADVIIKA
jgi:membrane fusion protein, multidrug efflux system